MANLTITLKTQAVNVWGPEPSQLWGSTQPMTWGVSYWGMKPNTAGAVQAIIADITKIWTGLNTIASTMPLMFNATRFWTGSNKVVVLYAPQDVEEFTGNGYNLVFVDRTVNDMSAAVNPYTSASVAAFTWTSQAAGSTTWS